jgi:fructokinase
MAELLGAVEAGGTKVVCAVGRGPDDFVDQTRIDTTHPTTTIAAIVDFFRPHRASLAAVGVASFGPVELRAGRADYGSVTVTPKRGWSRTSLVRPLEAALDVPVGFDTDVNGAALGEGRWGAARGLDTYVYLTLGTGVGGGAVAGGEVVHGLVHPEMGHVSVRRLPGDGFAGVCPFHGDCLEGMASGPALEARWGGPAPDLEGDTLAKAVSVEAHYLAEGLRTIVYVLAPERIVVGGGVSGLSGLFEATRESLRLSLGGYPGLQEHHDDAFVSPAGLGDRAGVAGAFVLAERAGTR